MAVSRERVVSLARTQVGVPFAHMGHEAGVRLDCAGLVCHVGRSIEVAHSVPPRYSRQPGQAGLIDLLDRYLARSEAGVPSRLPSVDDLWLGSVVLFRFARRPVGTHCGIVGRCNRPGGHDVTLIHSYSSAGRVVEHPFDAYWLGLVLKVYDFPSVEGCRWQR